MVINYLLILMGWSSKENVQAENLRYALRMLEHLIISPQFLGMGSWESYLVDDFGGEP